MTHEEYETLRGEILRKYDEARRNLRRERHIAEDKQQELSREYTRLNTELMRLRKSLRQMRVREKSMQGELNRELTMLELRLAESREA
jgi:hypothetical protein